ncbi:MAG: DUF2397 family protein [Comamonadaceae bacterium]|nr:DUF2397 family protein [Comamonadaceae bacterium]
MRSATKSRAWLAQQLRQEHRQMEAARARLASGRALRLSEIGTLDRHALALLLNLLGEALTAQTGARRRRGRARPAATACSRIRLEPLPRPAARRRLQRPRRDHVIIGRGDSP